MNKERLSSFGDNLSVVVIGSTGGLGNSFVNHFIQHPKVKTIYAFSRNGTKVQSDKVISGSIDLAVEDSIEEASCIVGEGRNIDIVIVATGLLHSGSISPEKSMRDLNANQLAAIFLVNTIGPTLVAKHFIPKLCRHRKSLFACLSARVGSISDNRLGGWYAYRSSKAALNMMLKNVAIETARSNKLACVVGLHPGTVDTNLSKPYQNNVSED